MRGSALYNRPQCGHLRLGYVFMPAHQDDHPPRLATEENPLRSGRGKKTEEDFINGEFLEEDAGRRKSNFKLALLHQFHFAADSEGHPLTVPAWLYLRRRLGQIKKSLFGSAPPPSA